jgi:hypothetical protein
MHHGCPHSIGYWMDPTTGERTRTPCRRLSCGFCGPRIALSTVKAIELARPDGSGVVLLPRGADALSDRERLHRFARVLRATAKELRAGDGCFEYLYVIEKSPAGLPHVHLLAHPATPSWKFRRALAIAGGKGDLQPIRRLGTVSRYCFKHVLRGLDHPHEAGTAMEHHLGLNGGKLSHSSRAFWRGRSGVALSGVREARRSARVR